MKYKLGHPCISRNLADAIRKAFNLNPAYPVRQIAVVVKARGVKHANEIFEAEGLGITFHRDYTSDTGNDNQLYLCDTCESGIIMSYNTCLNDFKTWDEIKQYYEQDV